MREAVGYYELELYEQALERTETLLREGLRREFAMSLRADCLRSLGRWDEAAQAFREYLAMDSEEISAYLGLGWCEKRAGRMDRAIEAMEKLLERHPEEPLGLYNLACYASLAGERERALELLRRAVQADRRFRKRALEEEDFSSIRDDPRFREIVARRRLSSGP